jgi:hypothetical protein
MSNDTVECPGCGQTMRDLWDHEWGHHQEIEVECQHCGKPFLLSCDLEYYARPKKEAAGG